MQRQAFVLHNKNFVSWDFERVVRFLSHIDMTTPIPLFCPTRFHQLLRPILLRWEQDRSHHLTCILWSRYDPSKKLIRNYKYVKIGPRIVHGDWHWVHLRVTKERKFTKISLARAKIILKPELIVKHRSVLATGYGGKYLPSVRRENICSCNSF